MKVGAVSEIVSEQLQFVWKRNQNLHIYAKINFKNDQELHKSKYEQVAFQSNANHPLAESVGYIKFEGM